MPQENNHLPYARQSISNEDILQVAESLRGDWITRGPRTEAFEEAVANACDAEYAVAFNSASSALNACYQAIDANKNDRIYTSPNTYIATISGGVQRGAEPVFLDIDLQTGNFRVDQLANSINQPSSRGRDLIVPVHFSGIAMDMQALEENIKKENTIVIEDAAHAIGSSYPSGEKIGSCAWSQMTVFSFHPAKTVTSGEGGMVTTNDPILNKRLRNLRNNGIEKNNADSDPWGYAVSELSCNFHMTEMQAALGISQFKKLEIFANKRRELITLYRALFKETPHIRMLTSQFDANTAFHLCVLLIDFEACRTTRTKVMQALSKQGIGTQVHYIPLYKHPFFLKNHPDLSAYFPSTETYYKQALTLPLYYDLTHEDIKRIAETLKSCL